MPAQETEGKPNHLKQLQPSVIRVWRLQLLTHRRGRHLQAIMMWPQAITASTTIFTVSPLQIIATNVSTSYTTAVFGIIRWQSQKMCPHLVPWQYLDDSHGKRRLKDRIEHKTATRSLWVIKGHHQSVFSSLNRGKWIQSISWYIMYGTTHKGPLLVSNEIIVQ